MAASLIIEEEAGVCTGRIHPHNGYYAGDFSARPAFATFAAPAFPLDAATADRSRRRS